MLRIGGNLMKRIMSLWITLFMVLVLGACSNESSLSDNVRRGDSTENVLTHSEVPDYEWEESVTSEENIYTEKKDIEMRETDSVESENSEAVEPESESVEQDNPETENTAGNPDNSVDPELKAVLDEYETFMNEYIDFMAKYKNSDDVTDMLSDYIEIMKQYADYMSAIEKYDPDEMSAADAAYYIDVTSRVSQKLLEAAY